MQWSDTPIYDAVVRERYGTPAKAPVKAVAKRTPAKRTPRKAVPRKKASATRG